MLQTLASGSTDRSGWRACGGEHVISPCLCDVFHIRKRIVMETLSYTGNALWMASRNLSRPIITARSGEEKRYLLLFSAPDGAKALLPQVFSTIHDLAGGQERHSKFRQFVTVTGRFSSSHPELSTGRSPVHAWAWSDARDDEILLYRHRNICTRFSTAHCHMLS